jgi:hypothetical protein
MYPVMQRRTLPYAIVLLAAALAGCGITEPSPAASTPSMPASSLAATHASSSSPAASGAAASKPWPTAPADCPVTIGKPAPAEIGSGLFGASSAAGNEGLWVGGLWPNGVTAAEPVFVNADGSIGMKFGWWRVASGTLAITGQRLDGTAPAATGDVPDGYGLTGFQASGITFPTEGCWEISGTVGSATLTFVTYVIKVPA